MKEFKELIAAAKGYKNSTFVTAEQNARLDYAITAAESRIRASEAAKYKAVVEAAKAFTSGGQAELCGACAYGRFNIRKLSTALAAMEGKE